MDDIRLTKRQREVLAFLDKHGAVAHPTYIGNSFPRWETWAALEDRGLVESYSGEHASHYAITTAGRKALGVEALKA